MIKKLNEINSINSSNNVCYVDNIALFPPEHTNGSAIVVKSLLTITT